MKRLHALLLLVPALLSSTAAAAPRKGAGFETSPRYALTRLRSLQPAVLIITKGGSRELRLLSVEVRNVGSAEAYSIQVLAVGGDGLAYHLKGPLKLAPRQRAVYTLRGRAVLPHGRHITITTSCANCPRG